MNLNSLAATNYQEIMWLEMRNRLFEGWDELLDEHIEEIENAFKKEFDISEDDDSYMDWLEEFINIWLVDHGYAFYDEVQGILPIKWKSIPREEWGEIPDPFLEQLNSLL